MSENQPGHGQFSIEKTFSAPVERVFEAMSSPEIKAKWFIGPKEWKLTYRALDFKVGGQEILRGEFGRGFETLFTARFHDIRKNEVIVYDYDMHLNGKIHSVSLSTVALEANGKKTNIVYTEQITFLDGTPAGDGTESRRGGTLAHFERMEAVL